MGTASELLDSASGKGQGYRLALGALFATWISFTSLLALVLIVWRRNHAPLNQRSPFYLVVCVAGCAVAIYIPLNEALGNAGMSCGVWFWLSNLQVPLFMTALGGSAFRLKARFLIERTKRRLAKSTRETMDTTALERLRFRTTNAASLLFTLFKLAPISVLCLILIESVDSPAHYDLSHTLEQCPGDDIQDIAFAFLFVTELCVALFFVRQLKNEKDALGLRSELKLMLVMGVVLYAIFALLQLPSPSLEHWFDTGYAPLVWYLYGIWLCVLRPAAETFPAYRTWAARHRYCCCKRAHVQPTHMSNDELLKTMLKSANGYNYLMLQMSREFCEETLLCVRAIEQFRRAPSPNALADVFTKFVQEGAPLQVNISQDVRRTVIEAIEHPELFASSNPASSRPTARSLLHPSLPSAAAGAAASAGGVLASGGGGGKLPMVAEQHESLGAMSGTSGDLPPVPAEEVKAVLPVGPSSTAQTATALISRDLATVLDPLREALLTTLRNDTIPRFVRSPLYKDYMAGKPASDHHRGGDNGSLMTDGSVLSMAKSSLPSSPTRNLVAPAHGEDELLHLNGRGRARSEARSELSGHATPPRRSQGTPPLAPQQQPGQHSLGVAAAAAPRNGGPSDIDDEPSQHAAPVVEMQRGAGAGSGGRPGHVRSGSLRRPSLVLGTTAAQLGSAVASIGSSTNVSPTRQNRYLAQGPATPSAGADAGTGVGLASPSAAAAGDGSVSAPAKSAWAQDW